MDSNAINLDDFDKSDISSDWNSSEDDAPAMEIESDHELENERMEELTEIALKTKTNDMSDSDGEQEVIPRKLS